MSSNDVSILEGIPQAITYLFANSGWIWIGAFAAFAISVGGMGGVSAWLTGTARLPYASGLDNYLPKEFSLLHPKYGTPHISFYWMSGFSSLLIVMSVLGSTITEAYLVLVDATLILYFIPYVYMFISVIVLRNRDGLNADIIPVPGGKLGLYVIPGLGLISTIMSIGFSLIPGADVSSPVLFVAKVVGGTAFFVFMGWFLYRHYSKESAAAVS
jgi:amino acid transporter